MENGNFVRELATELRHPVEVAGMVVVPQGYTELRAEQDEVRWLVVNTLTGIADYVKANVDEISLASCLLHVASPWQVWLRDSLSSEADRWRRHDYLLAQAQDSPFQFGTWMDPETFIIGLHTAFEQTEERDSLLTIVSTLRETSEAELRDDGVSQEVKTARGMAFVERTKLPNPVTLKPWRTFREVDQPESEFVLRARPSTGHEPPTLALFAADGGIWKLEAIEGIAAWLRGNVSGVQVIA